MDIGQYRIIKKIGEGGMSVVYLAEHIVLGKTVALKLLPTSLSEKKDIRERFLREAKILAKLNHPNIVTLHNFFEQQENLYLVMELVDGQTLDALIREKGTIPLTSCIPLFEQILAGVGFAHAKGIVHRDLKPSNVMINQEGLIKITDFGIAKLSGDISKTRTGIKLGTLSYMSPESIRGQEAIPQTDIYSLGVTFFEMITGKVPFTGDSEYHIMQTILENAPPSIKDFTADVPTHIEKAILKALAKSPADRFQTTQDFLQALQEVSPSPTREDDQAKTVHVPWKEMQTKTLRPGSVFAKRYEILREGKKGGMGVVYQVRDRKLNRIQALKVIRPQLSDAPQAMQRFRQEVSISLELLHPNIVRVHNLDEYEGIEYFTMEWVEGKNLRDILNERKKEKMPFVLSEVSDIMDQMTAALRYAHQHTVHRDIKPENILVTKKERGLQLKLTDFGIAKIQSSAEFVSATIQMGTPYYMSPEQKVDSSKVDLRTDIYSVGVILFELITLENTLGPELPSELNPALPSGIDTVYRKAVAIRPENRYQNMDEFLEAFHNVLSEGKNDRAATKEKPKINPMDYPETGLSYGTGTLIADRYQVLFKLGEGGMGKVYLTRDEALADLTDLPAESLLRAVKVLPSLIGMDLRAVKALKNEAALAATLNDPNIVRFYGYGYHSVTQTHYLVMEYVNGIDLQTCLGVKDRFTETEVRRIAIGLAKALKHAHEKSLVHLDIKPSNIILESPRLNVQEIKNKQLNQTLTETDIPDLTGAKVKLTDFGIARRVRESMSHYSKTDTSGTLPYTSPEQIRGKGIDHRSDLYSLGITLYELLTGNPPFQGQGEVLMRQIIQEEPDPIADIDPLFNSIILKLIGKDKKNRFRDADKLLVALQGMESKAQEEKKRAEEAERKRQEEERKKAEQERLKKEELIRAAAEAERKRLEEEAKKASVEAARKREEEEKAKRAQEEKKRAEEAERKRQEEERRKAEQERLKKEELIRAAAEAERRLKEEEAKKAVEEAARKRKKEEKAKRAQEEEKRVEETKRKRQEEKHRRTEEAAQRRSTEKAAAVQRRKERNRDQDSKENKSSRSIGMALIVIAVMAIIGYAIFQSKRSEEHLPATPVTVAAPAPAPVVLVPSSTAPTTPAVSAKDLKRTEGLQHLERAKTALEKGRLIEAREYYDESKKRIPEEKLFKEFGKKLLLAEEKLKEVEERIKQEAEARAKPTTAEKTPQEAEVKAGKAEEEEIKKTEEKAKRDSENRITNSLGMSLVLIPSGTFTMGSPSDEPGRKNDESQHRVTISNTFYMQTTEVTQGQWLKVMGNNPSFFKNCGDDCPVDMVSWNDVQEFIRKLNSQEGMEKYRLPTEAEWEYAARAGSTTAYSFGDDAGRMNDYAWYSENSKGQAQAVMLKRPNGWGLYDMHGNVWEWVQDWKGDYPSGSVTDPTGPSSGLRRVARGGSWSYNARHCRSAIRDRYEPGYRNYYSGFRLVRTK